MNFDHDYANYVNEEGVAEIRALEEELGTCILAYPTPPRPAALIPN